MRLLERMFHLTERGTTVRRELLGALTSFFSVAYILFVTPSYLSLTGMDYTGVLLATCLSSALACFLSAALDLPFMLAPGVGLNAFFTYTLCLTMGYTWAQALAVVSLSGVAYLVISLTPLREQMISCIPPSMKNAISAGLGLFIADVLLPLCYKWGVERARPWMYVVIFVPVLLFVGAWYLGLLDWLNAVPEEAVMALTAGAALLPFAGMLISWRISLAIMEHKDL